MGQSKHNPASNDYRGEARPNYTVGFNVIYAPCEAWVTRNKDAIEEANKNGTPPPVATDEDMRIGIMLCLLEVQKSPLKMVPDKTLVRPCAVVFSESFDVFKKNQLTPEDYQAMLAQQMYRELPATGEAVANTEQLPITAEKETST